MLKHLTADSERVLQQDEGDGQGVLSETEHTADKISYILCLLTFKTPNPNATIPTNP